MQQYAQVLRDQMDLDVPRQTVLIGSCWTPGILSFIDAYLKNSHPIIIITSNVEASVYGGVKQVRYHLCLNQDSVVTKIGYCIIYWHLFKADHNILRLQP